MEEALFKILAIYGPLGLGWVAAWYLLNRLQALQDRVLLAFIADTELKVSLRASIDSLIAAVKEAE